MDETGIVNLRLTNQQILRNGFMSPKDTAGWMGAIQAQDYGMAKWAIGLRTQDSTEDLIQAAVDTAEIIRTHVLRATWHFVSADHVYWMLELSSPYIKASMKFRHKQLELSESILSKSNGIIEKALRDGKHLTREELLRELGKAKIPLTENRASHLLAWAELEGIVCSGASKRGKLTYAILDERVPKRKSMTREEALAELARKYFTSHGPATVKDFIWWSGLPVNKARQALESSRSEFQSEEINGRRYWYAQTYSFPEGDQKDVHLLPAYDEYLIGYEDRSAVLAYEDFRKTVSNNGIFRPTIVVNGQVVGIWKRMLKKDKVIVEMEYFTRPDTIIRDQVEKVLSQYGNFLGRQIEIINKK
jgi:hypothetical protein